MYALVGRCAGGSGKSDLLFKKVLNPGKQCKWGGLWQGGRGFGGNNLQSLSRYESGAAYMNFSVISSLGHLGHKHFSTSTLIPDYDVTEQYLWVIDVINSKIF